MQNKGFVKVFAVLLTLICVFYLSFSVVTSQQMKKAKAYANGSATLEQEYLDSLANKKVWLGYTLKECREMEIGLGLDLKGGMNVILEVSVPDVIRTLADNKAEPEFNEALAIATKQAITSQDDLISLFAKEYNQLAPGKSLASLFATKQLKGIVTQNSSDADVIKALRSEVKAAVDNSFTVLRTRIDQFGVAQPNIQLLEGGLGRIMIELPGIKEPERVRKLLQGSANLEFWETYTAAEVRPSLQNVDARLAQIVGNSDDLTAKAEDLLSQIEAGGDSIALTQELNTIYAEQAKTQNPLLSKLQLSPYDETAVAGYAMVRDTATINNYLSRPDIKKMLPSNLSLKWGVSPDKNTNAVTLYSIKTERNGKAPLEGDVIVDAKNTFDQNSNPVVSMEMNSDGARKWAQLTKKNVGRAIAIVLDGYVYSAPNVNGEITGGSSQISGNFTVEETTDLANVLKSGKMAAPARIVQEDIIGPSLGQESINAGIFSFAVALVLLMIYMCSMYGVVPGMIANGALIFNLFFTLGILASFQAALTLSGIAGMVLALGMAVDANVLIYERTKEELRAGKGVKAALKDGYSNALSAILDSNITSIITGIILFNFGTGPIRGFATTLIIGIIASFFTAVFLTRLVYDYFLSKDKLLNLTFTSPISRKMFVNPSFNFVGHCKKYFIITGVILAVCVGSMLTKGMSESIDFTGGRNFKVQFEQTVEPEQVRSLIANKFGDDATVSVIAIGTDGKTVRISTNYRIDENTATIDSEIETVLYETLKPLLTQNISLETFIDRENHTGGSIISSQKVGPSIADDIKTSAIWSVVLALFAIGLYILIRFRNIAYSVGSVVALTSDTLMILGIYSIFAGLLPFSLEIDQTFIGAILTAIGYSINDKVVIFDRVREYFGLYPNRNVTQLFNDSLNTTLSRTINTSLSTLIVLLCIFILGGDSIRSFSFAMILGVLFGTFSSLFVAAPVAYTMMKRSKEKAVEAK